MNPIFREAAQNATGGTMMGIVTLLFLLFFTGTVLWLWGRRSKSDFDDIANLPLEPDHPATDPDVSRGG